MSLAYAVLGTLIGRHLHPYGVCTAVTKRIGRVWPVGSGQLYASLQRLERRGLVEPCGDDGDAACRYATTTAGARAFDAWLSAGHGAGPGDGRGYDDWLAHIAVCARLDEPALLRRAIDVHRHRCQLLERALPRPNTDVAERAARDLLRADLDWLEAVERELLGPATEGPMPRAHESPAEPGAPMPSGGQVIP